MKARRKEFLKFKINKLQKYEERNILTSYIFMFCNMNTIYIYCICAVFMLQNTK